MYVYVIGVPGALTTKFGGTSDLQRRLREIQNLSPVKLEVLWSCPGSNALEQAIHPHFAEARSHGKWFAFETDPLDLSRSAHRAIWRYTLVTLLGHLVELVHRGLARHRLPVRSDRSHQLLTVRRQV
ncbi:GIY-YIG nuclease family protein [Streptomyces sp. NPDC056707]|uniref:GIY-YIG nuclease family protein n=1 Tax=Streptomyces sp. NPDC056707 TaxID=3345919 RepID=UPI0036C7E1CC